MTKRPNTRISGRTPQISIQLSGLYELILIGGPRPYLWCGPNLRQNAAPEQIHTSDQGGGVRRWLAKAVNLAIPGAQIVVRKGKLTGGRR